ncbi:hypothetical protein DPM19_08525 [Actinomadura craniellae]|uniref:Adenylate kinase n=1 Tax=Actinomadura craniellae TaxID=2231787 RepID=A0A365H9M8_9ACTN|nr:nucleoside monophosphate kinase [Actinomadura craniellae]RAY15805.1 hypothetical protein DPM19_08525 [Actinomadura craniellae]
MGGFAAVFLMGPPGAGKTTMATLFAERTGARPVRSGEMLRRVAAESPDAALRRTLMEYLPTSAPVPPEVYLRAVRDAFREAEPGPLVFDGYPKSVRQCDSVPELLAAGGLADPAITGFLFEVTAETIERRTRARETCANCGNETSLDGACCASPAIVRRPDDAPDRLRDRYAEYRSSIEAIGAEFAARWPLHRLDVERPPETIVAEIIRLSGVRAAAPDGRRDDSRSA